jgi:hypothetical protein
MREDAKMPDPQIPHDHREYVEGCFRCDLSRHESGRVEADATEERIKADFAKHPGSWRPDPQNWFREGWCAGFAAGLAKGENE